MRISNDDPLPVDSRKELFFYRTQDGTEADLAVASGGAPKSLVEIKFSTTPKLGKSFHNAIDDLKTQSNFIVSPVESGYPIAKDVTVLGIKELDKLLTLV